MHAPVHHPRQSDHLLAGATYLLDGFYLLTRPGIRRYVMVPLLINMALFMGLFLVLRQMVDKFNQWITGYLPHWMHFVSILFWALFFVSFLLLVFYTFVVFANIVMAPFNSLLSEKIEQHLTGQTVPQGSLFANVKDVPRVIGRQLSLWMYYLPRALVLLLLFFVPFVQPIAAVLWFVFHAWFMVLTYVDYPTDNHRVPLQDVHRWLRTCRFTALGMGIGILVVTLVPVINFLVVPAAVAAATKLWALRGAPSSLRPPGQ